MTTTLMPLPKQQFLTALGTPLAGGLVYTYAAGTTNKKATYSDAAGTVQQPNPIPLNLRGEPDNPVYWSGNYRVDVRDLLGNLVYSVDNYNTDPAGLWGLLSSAGASILGFISTGVGAIARTVRDRLLDLRSANDYGTIQQAVDAAGATGCVLIPASYAGTDSYSNPNNISVLDMRTGNLGPWSWIRPSFPVTGYPLGNDLVLQAMGPADTYIEHYHVTTTTTTSLVIGWNYSVPIAAVKCGNIRNPSFRTGGAELLSTNAQLVIGRETANEEQVDQGNWHFVDATHIDILCTKTHTGTTDIDQGGSTLLGSQDLWICSHFVKPGQATTFNPGLRLRDLHGSVIAKIPSDTTTSTPYSSWQWGAVQTGANGTNADLVYRNAGTAALVKWQASDASTAMTLSDSGNLELAKGGLAVLGNAVTNGSSGEVQIGRNAAAITSTTDAVIAWSQNGDPLNPTATAGTLVLAARNLTNAEVVLASQNAVRLRAGASGILPGADNTLPLGSASLRYSTVYAGTGTINTSDQREKTTFAAIPDAVLDAWGEVRQQIGQYQWLDAIAKKGDAARLHFGIPAQAIEEAFARHGLNACRYGLFCEDPIFKAVTTTRIDRRQKMQQVEVLDFEFEQVDDRIVRRPTARTVMQPVTVTLNVYDADGNQVFEDVQRALLDDKGQPRFEEGKPLTETIAIPVTKVAPVFEDVEIEVEEQVPTGDTRKGVRVDECMWLDTAWVRRKLGA